MFSIAVWFLKTSLILATYIFTFASSEFPIKNTQKVQKHKLGYKHLKSMKFF